MIKSWGTHFADVDLEGLVIWTLIVTEELLTESNGGTKREINFYEIVGFVLPKINIVRIQDTKLFNLYTGYLLANAMMLAHQ